MDNTKKRKRIILILFAVTIIVIFVVCDLVIISRRHKAVAPSPEISNTSSLINYSETAKKALSDKDYPAAVDNYGKAIEADPVNTDNYIDKSAAEYEAGDKQAAIDTVKEGLEQSPNDELLKSKLDVLEKDTFNSSGPGNPRQ